ncbi:MAG: PorT family protein [Bacteroidales bacterium]|nr:MAG: PorT family protein [Bacteroidales bacterium]
MSNNSLKQNNKMKKVLLIITAVILGVNIGHAQDENSDSRTKLQLGIKAGINYSNVYDSEGEDFVADPKIGFVGGAFVAIPLGKFLGFQPEMLLSQKGFKATGSILGIDYDYTRTSTFIDVPLFLQLKPSEAITLVAGPQFSFLIKQKDKLGDSSIDQDFDNDNIRRNTMGFVLGIDICPSNLVISARAGWDIQNNKGDGTSEVPRYKNVWYQATIGFRF